MYSFPDLEPFCCSMSSSNCCFLTCIQVSQEAGQVDWYTHLFQNFPQLIVFHTIKGFGVVNKVEIDVFLELSCFFNDPADVGNSISGSSAFSKTSLNIWKFTVRVLLKPDLGNFEHYFTSMWDERNCAVVWACLGQREGRTESWELLIHTGSHGLEKRESKTESQEIVTINILEAYRRKESLKWQTGKESNWKVLDH